jgi:hypothetical protein
MKQVNARNLSMSSSAARSFPFTEGLSTFFTNLAAGAGGFLAGHAGLQLCAAILTAGRDVPRAQFVQSLGPIWNAFGLLFASWVIYYLIHLFGEWLIRRRMDQAAPRISLGDRQTDFMEKATSKRPSKSPKEKWDWRTELRTARRNNDAAGVLAVRDRLAKTWSQDRLNDLDRRLGPWFTKFFQTALLKGKAPDVFAELQRVAEIYAHHEQYSYFIAVLPTVRQCVEIQAMVKAEQEEADHQDPDEPTGPTKHEANGK